MTRTPDPIGLARDLLSSELRLGTPHTVGGLTLAPVIGGVPGPAYRTASQALAEGTLAIGEVAGGVVPQLVVRNRGSLPVLLLDGEHLAGAMQDRVLNVTVLAAPRHDTVIPVSCVERGRWRSDAARRGATTSPDHAHPALRAMNATTVTGNTRSGRGRHADQGAVWAEVDRTRAAMRARSSPTDSLGDVFEDRRHDLERIRRSFAAPGPAQTGVLAAAGGRVLALDAFDHPETLARAWDRLVRGYAADALTAEPVGSTDDALALTGFWRELSRRDAEATAHEGVGLGIDVILTSPATVSTALVWEGTVVHVAAFPRAQRPSPRPGVRPRAERTERPSVRARTHPWFHEGRSEP
jgi:hypothetical protein